MTSYTQCSGILLTKALLQWWRWGQGWEWFPCSHVSFPFYLHSCISEIPVPSNALPLKPYLVLRFQGNLWTMLSRLSCQCLPDDVGQTQGPNGRPKQGKERKTRCPPLPTSGGHLRSSCASFLCPSGPGWGSFLLLLVSGALAFSLTFITNFLY